MLTAAGAGTGSLLNRPESQIDPRPNRRPGFRYGVRICRLGVILHDQQVTFGQLLRPAFPSAPVADGEGPSRAEIH